MKPLELSCVLRCSKLQMQENGFKDAVVEWICALLLEIFAIEGYRISFPDFAIPAIIQVCTLGVLFSYSVQGLERSELGGSHGCLGRLWDRLL